MANKNKDNKKPGNGPKAPGKRAPNDSKANNDSKAKTTEMFSAEEQTEVPPVTNEAPAAEETVTPPVTEEVETPADAPVAPETPAEETGPVVSDEVRINEPVNETVPQSPSRETPASKPSDITTEPTAASKPTSTKSVYIGPGSPHTDEQKLQRYISNRNGITKLTNIQLGQTGINMSKIGLLVGRVGKFKLKRDFVVESWKITIE